MPVEHGHVQMFVSWLKYLSEECTETGHSVLEVVRTAEKVTGRAVPYDLAPRRQGDVAVLLASKVCGFACTGLLNTS